MTITSPSCTLNKVLLGGEAGWHDRESTRIGFSSLGTNSELWANDLILELG